MKIKVENSSYKTERGDLIITDNREYFLVILFEVTSEFILINIESNEVVCIVDFLEDLHIGGTFTDLNECKHFISDIIKSENLELDIKE